MNDENSDSPCIITDLESDLYNAIQEIRNDQPPLEIRKDLYTAAYQHAQNCIKKVHHNVKEGFESRRNLFRDAKRYIEINFVTKPLEKDPIPFISNILKSHYIARIQSQINSIGPVMMKLKSNKYIVIILGAFFRPRFSVRQFFVYFPKIREMKESSTDFETLVDLMNHFRIMHNYKPLMNKSSSHKSDSYKKALSKTVSYESKKASDLFCRLFTDQVFIDLIGEIWTDFSYSTEMGDCNSIITMHFYREEEEYTYIVDVKHPICKDPLNKLYSKYNISKDNDKINNNKNSIISDDSLGRDNINNETPYDFQKRDIPDQNNIEISNKDSKENNLSDEVEEALHILNDNEESDQRFDSGKIKRSPFGRYEPTGSPVPQTKKISTPIIQTKIPIEPKRYNSTSSLIPTKKIADFDSGKIPLKAKKANWGNLKPSLKSGLSEAKERNINSPNEKQIPEENNDNDEENEKTELEPNLDDSQVFMSDSSDGFILQPKQRCNSQTISLLDTIKSPWKSLTMTLSDEPFDEKEELKKIPSELKNSKLQMLSNSPYSGIPTPSNAPKHLSARPSVKGWSNFKIGKSIISPLKKQSSSAQSNDENSRDELIHPQKQIIKRASNAWSVINPEINQNRQINEQIRQNLSEDEVKINNRENETNEKAEDINNNENETNEKVEDENNNENETNEKVEDVNNNESENNEKVEDENNNENETNEKVEDIINTKNETNEKVEDINNNESENNENESLNSLSFSENGKEDNSENDLIKQSKKVLPLKGSHKAKISPLGQSFKKASLKLPKKKQPIKSIPPTSNTLEDSSSTKNDDAK